MHKLNKMERSTAMPSHTISTHPMANCHWNDFCWIGCKINELLQGNLQAESFHMLETKNIKHFSVLAAKGVDDNLIKNKS